MVSTRKFWWLRGISGQIAISLVMGWHPLRFERILAHSSSRKTFVQCGTVHDGTQMPFYLDGSLRPLIASGHWWRPSWRTPPPPWGWQYTHSTDVLGMSHVSWQRSPLWNPRKSIEICPFLDQILSVRLILSGRVWWSQFIKRGRMTKSCQKRLSQSFSSISAFSNSLSFSRAW